MNTLALGRYAPKKSKRKTWITIAAIYLAAAAVAAVAITASRNAHASGIEATR